MSPKNSTFKITPDPLRSSTLSTETCVEFKLLQQTKPNTPRDLRIFDHMQPITSTNLLLDMQMIYISAFINGRHKPPP